MRVEQLHSEYLLPLVVSVHLWICVAWQTVHERRTIRPYWVVLLLMLLLLLLLLLLLRIPFEWGGITKAISPYKAL